MRVMLMRAPRAPCEDELLAHRSQRRETTRRSAWGTPQPAGAPQNTETAEAAESRAVRQQIGSVVCARRPLRNASGRVSAAAPRPAAVPSAVIVAALVAAWLPL